MTVRIRCLCVSPADEPLTARAGRVSALLGEPEFRQIAGDHWALPTSGEASAADLPELVDSLRDLRAWTPSPADTDIAYQLSRWNGRKGTARCEVHAQLWLEASQPDQLEIELRRALFVPDGPLSLDAFVAWLGAKVHGTVSIEAIAADGTRRQVAAK